MPTIGEAVGALEASLFVGREGDLAAFREWLTAEETSELILNVVGPGGIGKSALLTEMEREAAGRDRSTVRVDGRDVVPTPDALLAALGGTSPDEAVAKLNSSRPLLVLDTFEELEDLTPFLQRELLPRLDTGVKVVIAGRYPLGRGWGPWQKLIRPLRLRGLRGEESVELLRRRGIDDPALVDAIVEATGGMPLAVSLAADMVQQLGVRRFETAREWRLVVRTLVERLLEDVDDPLLRELLEACSVVRQFDEQTLAAISGRMGIGRAFDRLCRLSVVRPAEHGLMLHDDIRRILSDDLRWRQPARHRALRGRALAYYRERAKDAPPGERAWLVAERLYLWGNELIQSVMFQAGTSEDVYLEAGDAANLDEVHAVWAEYLAAIAELGQGVEVEGFTQDDDAAWLERLVRHPAVRLRIARSADGAAVGFNTSLPVYRGSAELLLEHPVFAPLLQAYLGGGGLAGLPATPEATPYQYLLQAATGRAMPEAAQAALLRDVIGLFVLGGVYLTTVTAPDRKRLCEAIGFHRVEGARRELTPGAEPAEGFVLDLSGIGVETWLEAIVSGRRPPRGMSAAEVEEEVQNALLSWRDDEALARSPLLDLIAGDASDLTPAEAVRRLLAGAIESARTSAGKDQEIAYRALELAYLEKSASHERVAERLAVSRSTFYRLLKRGVQGTARALTER